MTLQIEYSLKTLKKENDSLKKQLFKFDNNAINEVLILLFHQLVPMFLVNAKYYNSSFS